MRRPLLLALLLAQSLCSAAAAVERQALVIGNAAYVQAPLVNTRNDAADMAAKLRGLGFTVTHRVDLGRQELGRAVTDFIRQVRGSDAVALFYYAGHGLQVGGRNYLVPVDFQVRDELDVPNEAFPVDNLLAGLNGRSDTTVNLIVLDACRNNPFKDTDQRAIGDAGLAPVSVATGGTLILYATRPGKTASDNPGGRNGLFTRHLLSVMDRPGLQVEAAFKQVAAEVYRASGKTQFPWPEGVIIEPFFFVPPAVAAAPATAPATAPAAPPSAPALGHLQLSVDAPGARVRVDGREVGTAAPGAPLNLPNLGLGTVQVEVTAPGRQRVTQAVALKPDAWTQTALRLPPAGPAAGETWTEPKTGMDFLWVPGGTFTMGCGGAWAGECYNDEKPPRRITLAGYWMAKTEVTQAQWTRVMGSNPSHFKGCDTCPVDSVSWDKAQGFIAKLDPGGKQGLRLPTEAQWEYACRSGGREETYCGGTDPKRLAWYDENSGSKTHPVAGKSANGLGLYDMSGNVWEWTCSGFANPFDGSEVNCLSNNDAKTSPLRALRGGSWDFNPRGVRAASRFGNQPGVRNDGSGFRLARTLDP